MEHLLIQVNMKFERKVEVLKGFGLYKTKPDFSADCRTHGCPILGSHNELLVADQRWLWTKRSVISKK
jgi:thymidine phosphorylase